MLTVSESEELLAGTGVCVQLLRHGAESEQLMCEVMDANSTAGLERPAVVKFHDTVHDKLDCLAL